MSKPVWGVVKASVAYHSTTDCPRLVDRIAGDVIRPIRYESEDAAFKAGHLQMCGMCAKGIPIEYEDGMYMRLTAEQISTLKIISSIYAKTQKPLTLSDIAVVRDRKVSTCYLLVSRLVKKGLVKKLLGKRGKKALNRSLLPTALSARVLSRLPA